MTSYAKRVRARYPGAVLHRPPGGPHCIYDSPLGVLLAKARTPAKAWAMAANALEAPIEGTARVVGNAVEVTLPADHPLVVGMGRAPFAELPPELSAEVMFEQVGDRIRIVSVGLIERVRQPQTPNPAFDAFVARLSKGETE